MKKKFKTLFALSVAGLASIMALTGCPGGGDGDTRVADIIKQAEKMDKDDLYKKAMEEIKGKSFTVVANSSRMKNAVPAWVEYCKTHYENPDFTVNYVGTQPKNNQIFAQIKSDVTGANHTIDMTLIQDGSQIKSKMTKPGYLLNYIPKEWAGNKANDGEPLALQSLSKVFCWNTNGGNENKYTNCWDFALKKDTQFMTPKSEPVGQNFLYMLTRTDYAAVVKGAYDQLSADDKATVNATIANKDAGIESVYADLGVNDENVKYSLAWIYTFLKNYRAVEDDGPISQNLTVKTAEGAAGLLVYSKFRSIEETENVSVKQIAVAAYQEGFKGFGGYMYKHYLQILKTSPHPWTSCALINFMVTEHDGFQPWGKDAGGYCSNPQVQATFDHSRDGYVDNVNVYPVKNDKGYDWWTSTTGGKLVIEDGEYASRVAVAMADWIAYL